MIDKLKPCPFCGGKAKTRSYDYFVIPNVYWGVVCTKCFTQTYVSFESEQKAIKFWNTRKGE